MNRGLTVLLACFVMWAGVVRADSIVLISGARLEGEIVDENEQEVRIRLPFGTRGIKYVESIKRSRIERIERSPVSPSTAPAVATRPASSQPANSGSLKKQSIEDKSAHLHEAIKKWKSNDALAAGIALSRLINNCNGTELQKLSAEVERELEMPLAELAAEADFVAAQRAAKGRAIRLYYVTSYELPVLIHRLSDAFDSAMEESIQPKRPSSPTVAAMKFVTSQPATETKPNGLSIAAWIDQPDALNVQPAEAGALVRHIQYAASLLTERIRLDAQVRSDRSLKSSLLETRIRLTTLARVAGAIANGQMEPATPKPNGEQPSPTAPAGSLGGPRGEGVLDRQQEAERARIQQETYLQKALRLAQEQAETKTKK